MQKPLFIIVGDNSEGIMAYAVTEELAMQIVNALGKGYHYECMDESHVPDLIKSLAATLGEE